MDRCSGSFSGRSQSRATGEDDGVGAARPNDFAQISELLGQRLSRTEFENRLNEWVRDGTDGENRLLAKERLMACFDAQQNDPTSRAAFSLDLSYLGLRRPLHDPDFS
jgi:hypothetical protein